MKDKMIIDTNEHSKNIEKFAENFETNLKGLHLLLTEEFEISNDFRPEKTEDIQHKTPFCFFYT